MVTNNAIDHILENNPNMNILIMLSDNCQNQYKSAHNFYDLQKTANKYGITIYRIYGVPGHGKAEVDVVGAIIKMGIRREVGKGDYFKNAKDVTEFTKNKYRNSNYPEFLISELLATDLTQTRTVCNGKKFKTVEGSSKFAVCKFVPQSECFWASPRLCICDICFGSNTYGTCPLFVQYMIDVHNIEGLFHKHNCDTDIYHTSGRRPRV